MILSDTHSKVTNEHLQKNAYLYVRQSTMKQVLENTESTKRQYSLQQKAIALGWHIEQIVVIDTDVNGDVKPRKYGEYLVVA